MKNSNVHDLKDYKNEVAILLKIEDEEAKDLTKNIDFERIKRMALKGIQEEKNNMMSMNIRKQMKKAGIVAASVMILGGTVFALGHFDYFKLFYGNRTNISSEDKTAMNKSVISSGVKMSLNESIIGGNSGIIMVSFEKEDGTAFPKNAVIPALELEPHQKIGYMVGQKVTEDGSKLIGNFEVDSVSSLNGENITVKADKIVDSKSRKIIAKGPWENKVKIDMTSKLTSKDISMDISHGNEKMVLKHIDISAIGVEIQGERLDKNKDMLPEYAPEIKVLMRDGKNMKLRIGSTSQIENGFKWQFNLDAHNNMVFIKPKDVKSIVLSNETIDMK